MSDMLH